MMITNLDKAYIAGFFDGEGTLTVVRGRPVKWAKYRQHRIAMVFYNNNREILEWLQTVLGGKLYYRARKQRHNQFASMLFMRSNLEILKVLKYIQNYVKIKKKQVTLGIKFLKLREVSIHKHSAHNPLTDEQVQLLVQIREANMANSQHSKPLGDITNNKEEWKCLECGHIYRPRLIPPRKCPRPKCQKHNLIRVP